MKAFTLRRFLVALTTIGALSSSAEVAPQIPQEFNLGDLIKIRSIKDKDDGSWGCDEFGKNCRYPTLQEIDDVISVFQASVPRWKMEFKQALQALPYEFEKLKALSADSSNMYGPDNLLSKLYGDLIKSGTSARLREFSEYDSIRLELLGGKGNDVENSPIFDGVLAELHNLRMVVGSPDLTDKGQQFLAAYCSIRNQRYSSNEFFCESNHQLLSRFLKKLDKFKGKIGEMQKTMGAPFYLLQHENSSKFVAYLNQYLSPKNCEVKFSDSSKTNVHILPEIFVRVRSKDAKPEIVDVYSYVFPYNSQHVDDSITNGGGHYVDRVGIFGLHSREYFYFTTDEDKQDTLNPIIEAENEVIESLVTSGRGRKPIIFVCEEANSGRSLEPVFDQEKSEIKIFYTRDKGFRRDNALAGQRTRVSSIMTLLKTLARQH